jgi:quinol monooxygenase YgiN
MIVLAVTWKAHPGKEAEVARLFAILQAESRTEPGCRMYVVHQHLTDPARFFVYEQYDDQAALDAHRASAHFQRYARTELPKLGERVEGELYQPI